MFDKEIVSFKKEKSELMNFKVLNSMIRLMKKIFT